MRDRAGAAHRAELRLLVRTVAIWWAAATLLTTLALTVGLVSLAMWDVAAGHVNGQTITPSYCGDGSALTAMQLRSCQNADDLQKVGFSTAVTAATVVLALLGAAMTAVASATRAQADAVRIAGLIDPDSLANAKGITRRVIAPLAKPVDPGAPPVQIPTDKVLPG